MALGIIIGVYYWRYIANLTQFATTDNLLEQYHSKFLAYFENLACSERRMLPFKYGINIVLISYPPPYTLPHFQKTKWCDTVLLT